MATKEALGKTEQINGRRYYNVEEGTQYPSVTTILGAFADQSGLDKWRKRVGEAEANRISKFSANRGTVMHQLCEYYILSEKPTPKEKREEALEILGLESDADKQTIKDTIRKLRLENHPDKGGNQEKFDKINKAANFKLVYSDGFI